MGPPVAPVPSARFPPTTSDRRPLRRSTEAQQWACGSLPRPWHFRHFSLSPYQHTPRSCNSRQHTMSHHGSFAHSLLEADGGRKDSPLPHTDTIPSFSTLASNRPRSSSSPTFCPLSKIQEWRCLSDRQDTSRTRKVSSKVHALLRRFSVNVVSPISFSLAGPSS